MEKYWIARDKDGTLWLFDEKPVRSTATWELGDCEEIPYFTYLPNDKFPEITWNDEPKEVEIEIKVKEHGNG